MMTIAELQGLTQIKDDLPAKVQIRGHDLPPAL